MRSRLRILIIDEFQDTDGAQRDIAFAVGGHDEPGESGPQLLLVGDPKQSIYGFRGADITVWSEVREALCPNGDPMALTHNFRSEPTVVDFVNRVCGRAMDERAEAVAAESPRSEVRYQALVANRPETVAGGLEWLAADSGGNVAERLEAEGKLIASRIRQLVGDATVFDPEKDEYRSCRYRDIAVLARKKKILTGIEVGLREYGVPYFNSVTGGLADRREVMDLVTVLRLIANPRDDLRAFAFLRSPFVGLRDEVLARIRLDRSSGKKTYLRQADAYLTAVTDGSTDWFEAPEGVLISEIERKALRTGLTAINQAQALVDRAEPSDLLEGVLEATGYRLHLLLGEAAEEALANIERFLALLEDYRHLPVSRILDLWDLWGDQDLGIPQAPLSSKDDDVVTLSTIHTAKGLEWPVVVLAGTRDKLLGASDRFWSDPEYGPVFLPKKAERGPRAEKLLERVNLEGEAEEARLLYVAATRARDRLVVAGPTEGNLVGYAAWLGRDLDGALEEAEASARFETAGGDDAGNDRPAPSAHAHDEATGTGRQMDAFGGDHPDGKGQLDMFTVSVPAPADLPEPTAGTAPAARLPRGTLVVHRSLSPIQGNLAQMPVALWWLSKIMQGEAPALVRPIRTVARSFMSSASELMMKENDPDRWSALYVHGVELADRFAPASGSGEVPAHVRGTLIHGVLERIRDAEELSRILNETIGGIDAPDLEEALSPGSRYREALEQEIEQVVSGPLWRWYVEGDHHRELPFIHLAGDRNWIHGAFDLYRPAAPDSGVERDLSTWIIDFKTHGIEESAIPETAREYRVQADVYMEAVRALLDPAQSVRLALHFTRPNRSIEMS
jgi:ATP-dependent exoDNAse (exonuclease V) beta subunit